MYYLYKEVSNSINGIPHLNIFGSNVNIGAAIALKTFDANCLNACDTPNITAGPFPPGTFSFYTVAAGFPALLPIGTKLLVVS